MAPPIWLLVALSMVSPVGINILAPSMTAFMDVFDTDYASVQLTLTFYLIAVALTQLVMGPLSDRFGRRPVIFIGMAASLLGSIICVLSPTIEFFIVGRILQGGGASVGITLSRTIIRDIYGREKSASMIGYVTMGMAVAPAITPFFGGLMQENVGWWASSAFMVGFTLLVIMAAAMSLTETNPYLGTYKSFPDQIREYRTLLAQRKFLAYIASTAFATAVYFSFMGGAPLLATELLGLSPSGYGLYFAMIAGGYLVGNFVSGRYSETLGIKLMILLGGVLNVAAIAIIMMLFGLGYFHPLSLFAPAFFLSFANGLCLPSGIAGAISIRPNLAGAASGVSAFTQVSVGAVATIVTAALLDQFYSIWTMIGMMGLFAFLTLLVGLLIYRLEG